MAELVALSQAYPSRYGVPVVRHADPTIFDKRYYTDCLGCGFCADRCCSYGVDVDLLHVDAMMARREALEAYTGVAAADWFQGDVVPGDDMPGGGTRRTNVADGACVFLDRERRGCQIHRFADEFGLDYHDLKSIVDCLFPLTVNDDTLAPADEVDDGTLVCVAQGPTLFEGLRGELTYYFGTELVAELERMRDER